MRAPRSAKRSTIANARARSPSDPAGASGCAVTQAIQWAHSSAVWPRKEVAYSTRSAHRRADESEERESPCSLLSIARTARGSQQSAAACKLVQPTELYAAGSAPAATERIS
jgi:hypothetical protein